MCELEDCMYRDFKGEEGCTTQVYYNQTGDDLRPSEGPDPAPLDDSPHMTGQDDAKIQSLNTYFVAFLDKCIAIAARHAKRRNHHSAEFKKMKAYRRRVVKHALT